MLRGLRSYLRQHHIALLALFIALGGTSYAAIKLPANSVGSAQLKNKAVTPKKVSKAAVKLFRGKKGATGSRGATGLTGPTGPQGASGGTAWAFRETAPGLGSETPIPASATTVLSLTSPIHTSFTGGILATATVTIRQTGAATTPSVSCHLVIDGAPGIEQQVTFVGAIGEYKHVSMTFARSRPAGNYGVSVVCTSSVASTLGYSSGSLTVHAAAG